jgi:hypothetical protein
VKKYLGKEKVAAFVALTPGALRMEEKDMMSAKREGHGVLV